MRTSKVIPPIYSQLKKRFGANWDKGVVITYGDVVYCKFDLPPDLLVHEETHVRQQAKYGVEAWWERYFVDKKFRLDQEIEAYKNQVVFIRENYKNPDQCIQKLAKDMAEMYGNMVSRATAMDILLS